MMRIKIKAMAIDAKGNEQEVDLYLGVSYLKQEDKEVHICVRCEKTGGACACIGTCGGSGPFRTPLPVVEFETRDGVNGSVDWRAVDWTRKVCTPWLGVARTTLNESVTRSAVIRTVAGKASHRHSVDGDWTIVHSY